METEGRGAESDFESRMRDVSPIQSMIELEPEEQCMLMYSSGTTGQPKGVIITHRMMFFGSVNAGPSLDGGRDMVSLSVMPLFHIRGLQVLPVPRWV